MVYSVCVCYMNNSSSRSRAKCVLPHCLLFYTVKPKDSSMQNFYKTLEIGYHVNLNFLIESSGIEVEHGPPSNVNSGLSLLADGL